jgi:restriction system protein
MAVPTYEKFIDPILRYLAAHPEGAPARDVHEAAAVALQISDADRQQLLPSGVQTAYKNRAGWGHDRLKRVGLSISPRRGVWQLTPKGIEFARQNPPPLSREVIAGMAATASEVRLTDPREPEAAPIPEDRIATPDERLGEALAELRAAVVRELHRLGYGANRSDLQRVGGTGDGGIDGVISLDKLGLEKVYVQAKRWKDSVGRPEIQAFYGALAGNRARKGVFITTSVFTQQALDFARSVEGIVLVDGPRLAELMIDYEIGVTARTLKIPKLDSDYFDEESA